MTTLYEKSIIKLELDQVLSQLADCACSRLGKDACLQIRPVSDLEDVLSLLQQTTVASDLCTKKGNPNFSGVSDVDASLERADRGGSLTPKELLEIGAVLRCCRNVKAYISDDDPATILDDLFDGICANKYLEDKIFAAIISEEEIADTASSELANIRRHMPLCLLRLLEIRSLSIRTRTESYARMTLFISALPTLTCMEDFRIPLDSRTGLCLCISPILSEERYTTSLKCI